MYRTGISLTDEQRQRLEKLQEQRGFRSMSAAIGWAIDKAWAANQERITETAGAQNPERETKQKTGGTICLK